MSAFDENMDPSSSSLSSSLKRDRDSPAEVKPVGTKVRILPLRMRVFLLFSMGVLEAFFYRGVRKMQISLPVASRSHKLFETCCGGGLWLLVRARGDTRWTEPILKCFSGPFCPRSHRCCASTLPIQNARQPSWAFCCALGGWWLGRCGVAGAPGAHLQGGQGPNVGWRAFYTRNFWEHPSHLCPYSGGYLFFFLAPFDARPGPWLYLARVQLMGAHPHQQPATAGHTSTKTPAEIRKAMAVGLAVIAAGGHERRFFSGPPFTGGAWGTGGRSGLAHVAVLARKCHTRGPLPAVVEGTI